MSSGRELDIDIIEKDFILEAVNHIRGEGTPIFTHAILNPPYRKIHSQSNHRLLLRTVGVETVNLYTAFVALSLELLEKGGELVAILPRSFCNGLYY
jgi:adenine-specific DNA-methyltransferase